MGSKCFCQILLSGLIRGMRLWVEMFLLRISNWFD